MPFDGLCRLSRMVQFWNWVFYSLPVTRFTLIFTRRSFSFESNIELSTKFNTNEKIECSRKACQLKAYLVPRCVEAGDLPWIE